MNSPDSFRYRFAALVLCAAIALIVFPAAAHAPSDIQLSYDDATQQLSVTITHVVDNPQTHYIRNVKVKVNDVVSVDMDYKSQPTADTFTYLYNIPLKRGDTIRVTATCIQGPSLTKVMDITAPTTAATAAAAAEYTVEPAAPLPQPTPLPVSTQKSSLGLLPVIAAAAFVLVKKR
jgi:hypothetical protein